MQCACCYLKVHAANAEGWAKHRGLNVCGGCMEENERDGWRDA